MMNRSLSQLLPSRTKAGGLVAALLLPVPALFAQSLVNAGFEAETFSGTVAANSAISGWTTTTPALVGLNQFADNGTAPGGNSAFLQQGGILKTTVSGLTAGTVYHVSFRANAATGSAPYMTFSTDASAVTQSSKVSPVGGTAAYAFIAYDFTATSGSQEITIENTRASGTHNLVIDSLEVTLSDSTWSYHAWTGDADSGIDSQYAYSHAINSGSTTAVTVNGVPFVSSGTTNVQVINNLGGATAGQTAETNVPGRIVMTGGNAPAAFTPTGITGSSLTLGRDLTPGNLSISLANLKPNTAYVASFYGAGWDQSTSEERHRAATFSVSTAAQKTTVDLNQFGHQQGIVLDCHYVSDSNGNAVIGMVATGSNQWHTSAFSNREAVPDAGTTAWTNRKWIDSATSGIDGTYVYTHAFNFHGSGSNTINGVPFTNLAGSNPSGTNFTSYRLEGNVADTSTNVTGASSVLATNFYWAYTPSVMTLSALTPGKKYVFSLYSVGWEVQRDLLFTGSAGGKAMQVNQGLYGVDNGICMEYTYVAPQSGKVVISAGGFGAAYAVHSYAITNREAEAAADIAPTITQQPANATIAAGSSLTLSAGAIGSPVLHYQWYKGGNPVPSATGATYTIASVTGDDAGSYTCLVSNDALPAGVSTNAAVVVVRDAIPGLYSSGTGWNRALLPDGKVDPHYYFTANPHAPGSPQVLASTAHPAWAPPNATSKWISPVASHNISGASATNPNYYIYRTEFYLAGFDPASVSITGKWYSDNQGVQIRLNGVSIGYPNTAGATYSNAVSFTINPTVVANAGAVLHSNQPNTLDFVVTNDGAGSTGLMVRDLLGTGIIAAGTPPVVSVHPASGGGLLGETVMLGVVASGSGPLSYQWKRNGVAVGAPTANPWLAVLLEDGDDYGSYTVTVSNAANPTGVTSNAAVVSLPALPPFAVTTEKNTPLVIDSFEMLDSAGVGYAFGTLDDTSTEGGTVAIDVNGFITYTPPVGFVGEDSFHYTLTSASGSHPGTVTVTVTGVPDDITPADISLVLTPGLATVSFTGVAGVEYTLERSTTLVPGSWETVGSMVAPASGLVSIPDDSPPTGKAFYRVTY